MHEAFQIEREPAMSMMGVGILYVPGISCTSWSPAACTQLLWQHVSRSCYPASPSQIAGMHDINAFADRYSALSAHNAGQMDI